MADLVLDLMDRRPIWSIPPWAVAGIKEVTPPAWSVHVCLSPADGSGDGAGGALADEVLQALEGARVYIGFGVPSEVLDTASDTLQWVHSATAGVGGSLHGAMRRSNVPFTNSAGIHGPPMAETVLGMILHFFRGFPQARAALEGGRWDPSAFWAVDTPVRELSGARVGIIGLGGIGLEVAWRVSLLGARVRALRSRSAGSRRSPDRWRDPASPELRFGVQPPEPGLEIVHSLNELLANSDVLVITAPETPETRGMIDREALARLPRGAVLINVSRGALVDEEALVEALGEGRLLGAGLDVFASEPLPAESRLRALGNVLLTPHVSGVTTGFWRREVDLVTENMRRLLGGRPLLNRVDVGRGY